MLKIRHLWTVVLLAALNFATSAHAHFTLTAPASWLNEDAQGNPQKASPCGADASDMGTPSNKVTTFHAGEKITVTWTDTIAHPGHFRIALAADRADLKDPTIKQDAQCSYDESMVPKEATGNVLADGIFFRSRNGFSDAAGKMFSQEITLPNTPCDNCTLQVMQVMENDIQALSNCYYHHCANLKILPADGSTAAGSAGSMGSTPAAGSSASAGQNAGGSSAVAGSSSGSGTQTTAGVGAAGMNSVGAAGKSASPESKPTAAATGGAAGSTTPAVAAGTKSTPTAGTPATTSTASTSKPQTGTTTSSDSAAPAASSGGCSAIPRQTNGGQGWTFTLALAAGLALRRSRRRLSATPSSH